MYNYRRPITAIQQVEADGNPETTADPAWTPLLATPSFPEYTSGHTTFSGTLPSVLAHFFSLAQTMCLSLWEQMTCPVSTAATSSFRNCPSKRPKPDLWWHPLHVSQHQWAEHRGSCGKLRLVPKKTRWNQDWESFVLAEFLSRCSSWLDFASSVRGLLWTVPR